MVKPPSQSKRRSTNGFRSLSKLSEPLISNSVRDRGALLNQILILWPQIAGEVAIWSRPIAVSFSKTDRTDTVLKLEIDSGRGPIASMMIPELINSINKACGFIAIKRISLVQSAGHSADYPSGHPSGQKQSRNSHNRESPKPVKALPAQKLEEVTRQISSPELRASLIRLGQRLRKN